MVSLFCTCLELSACIVTKQNSHCISIRSIHYPSIVFKSLPCFACQELTCMPTVCNFTACHTLSGLYSNNYAIRLIPKNAISYERIPMHNHQIYVISLCVPMHTWCVRWHSAWSEREHTSSSSQYLSVHSWVPIYIAFYTRCQKWIGRQSDIY